MVTFVDEGGHQQTVKMVRPNLVGFTPEIWNELNTNQAGRGMWLAASGIAGKVRIVDVQSDVIVNVGPPVTMAEVAELVHGVARLADSAVPPALAAPSNRFHAICAGPICIIKRLPCKL